MSVHNLFFAVRPDEAAAESLAKLAERARQAGLMSGDRVAEDRLLMTLIHLGNFADQVPKRLCADAIAAAGTIDAQAFDVTFHRIGGTGRTLLLRPADEASALHSFQRRLTHALIRAGVKPAKSFKFQPHVTLSYEPRDVAEMAIDPVTWSIRDFSFIESLVGEHRHIERGRWPLGPAST